MASASAAPEAAAAASAAAPAASERRELSDVEFIKYLVNEDISCPVCFRPFVDCDIRDVPELNAKDFHDFVSVADFKKYVKIPEGFVIPILLNCNHAMCEDCARNKYFEKDVVFVGDGVRCRYQKRDQLGNNPCTCLFLTKCKSVDELSVSGENMLIVHTFRSVVPIALGVKNRSYGEEQPFFYYFKFCHHCQKESKKICTDCNLPVCDACWDAHHKGHKSTTVDDYNKNRVQSHECEKCAGPKKNQAFKYCAKCKLFLCRNRNTCYDPCMDPDHLLIEFDPSLVEIKRFEYNAVDNSRKMFIHDVHDYLETDPFIWQAADMECLGRTMYYQERKRCGADKPADGAAEPSAKPDDVPADGAAKPDKEVTEEDLFKDKVDDEEDKEDPDEDALFEGTGM